MSGLAHQNNQDLRPVILGQFSPQVLACLRSWGRKGLETGFICIGQSDIPAPQSRYLSQWSRLDPDLLYTDEGLETIISFLKLFQATGLICVQERLGMWLNRNREYLTGFELWVPPTEVSQNVLSKRAQIDAAREVGLKNLPTYFLDLGNLNVLQKVPLDHFPLCLRPSGEGKVIPNFKVQYIQTQKHGQEFIQGLQYLDSPLIAQPFKSYPNLVVHGARSSDNLTYSLQGFIVERKFEGLTLTIRPIDLSKDFLKLCSDFTSKLGIQGNFHFEFLFDPATSEAYFLEINARLGGTTAKVLSCGYDEPTLALQAFGVPLENNHKLSQKTASSKLALAKYLLYTLRNRITNLDYPNETKWKRVINTLWGMAFYRDDVISFSDIKGTWSFYRQAVFGKK